MECWGDNNTHSLGDPSRSFPSLSPIPAVGVKSMVSVVTGQFHSCGLQISGLVSCWGSNSWANLGTLVFAPEGTEVTVTGLANAVSVSAGDLHTCAVRADGTVWCWGDDTFGKLGNATIPTAPSYTAVQVTGVSGAVTVAAEAITPLCAPFRRIDLLGRHFLRSGRKREHADHSLCRQCRHFAFRLQIRFARWILSLDKISTVRCSPTRQ